MSWRTVIISSRCKLDLKMGCSITSIPVPGFGPVRWKGHYELSLYENADFFRSSHGNIF